jgi:hypothetical protein
MMEPQLLGSNQLLLQQQQQQVCMPLGGAMVCNNSQMPMAGSPLAQVRLKCRFLIEN